MIELLLKVLDFLGVIVSTTLLAWFCGYVGSLEKDEYEG